jgi:hypothetical protein
VRSHISDQCVSSKRSYSCCGLLFFSFFFSLVFRLSKDFILVASLPKGAVSVFGLGSGCDFSVASCDFAVASSSSTSLLACASASLRRASSSLVVFATLETSVVVALVSAAALVLLTGFDSARGADDAVGSFGLARARSSLVEMMLTGCLTGVIMSHTGSVGLDGSDEEDIGRSIVIWELPHSPPSCLGE